MLKSPPQDLKIEIERLGELYRGVVEDNNDPKKAGRVRVRIHGLHTHKTIKSEIEGIPINELPWAEPILPINEGSISGFGIWSVPLQGSHVVCFFEDGNPSQLRYFGSYAGIPSSKSSYDSNVATSINDGFKDPNGEYPSKLNEPDFHRLARGIKVGTLVDTKNSQRDIGVPTALGGSWSEPQSPYNAKYPHNFVINTHGGLTIELDSTPGATRINIYHPSNSFIEIDKDGNMVVKNNAEKYEIVTEGKNIHIKQQRNLTIDGNSKKKIGGNEQIEIDGNKEESIDGNKTENIGGNKIVEIDGNKTENIGGNETIEVDGNVDETIHGGGDCKIDQTLTIEVDGLINIKGNGNILIESGNVDITGGTIQAGSQSTIYKLVNELMIDKYNNHIHKNSGGADEPRDQYKLAVDVETTTNLEAS